MIDQKVSIKKSFILKFNRKIMILKFIGLKLSKNINTSLSKDLKKPFVDNVFSRDNIMPFVSVMYFLWIKFAIHVFCKDKIARKSFDTNLSLILVTDIF